MASRPLLASWRPFGCPPALARRPIPRGRRTSSPRARVARRLRLRAPPSLLRRVRPRLATPRGCLRTLRALRHRVGRSLSSVRLRARRSARRDDSRCLTSVVAAEERARRACGSGWGERRLSASRWQGRTYESLRDSGPAGRVRAPLGRQRRLSAPAKRAAGLALFARSRRSWIVDRCGRRGGSAWARSEPGRRGQDRKRRALPVPSGTASGGAG